MLATLKELKQHKVISEGDYYFAQLIAGKQPDELSREQKNLAILLAALCSYSYQQGNTCLFLRKGWNLIILIWLIEQQSSIISILFKKKLLFYRLNVGNQAWRII